MVKLVSHNNNKKIRVLIVEDELEIRRSLLNFLGKDADIEICAFLVSGMDIISEIEFYKPDVVITEFLATDACGTLVLEKINLRFKENKPKIIVISSTHDSRILEKAFKYGINYYLEKPIILSLLKDAILLISRKNNYEMNDETKAIKIKNLVRSFGIPLNILGYTYIVEALTYMIKSRKTIFLSEVYKEVSKKHNTSLECVEVSIRNAIKKASINPNDNFKSFFEFCNYRPSNSIFLSGLKEKFFIENMGM